MIYNKKLLIGAVSTVLGNPRNAIKAMVIVCDEINCVLFESKCFLSAPFKYVSLILLYGNKTNLSPQFGKIIKKYGELPITVELEMDDIMKFDREKDKLLNLFRFSIIQALVSVAEKYDLPTQKLEEYKSSIQKIDEL